ncbi:MAG: MFS transporter [Armatimonadota bacterium]
MTESAPVKQAGQTTPQTSTGFLGLPRNVVRLGLVSFFADVSSEMLYPLTPIFLTAVLGAPMAVLGFIEGAAEATASVLRTVSGRLSDLSGRRRPYVLGGYTISALAKPLIAAATALGWPAVLVARIADRFGKGLRTSARDAWIADSTPPEARGRAFGWHRAMDSSGAVLGPLLTIGLVYLLLVYLRHTLAFTLQFMFVFAVIPGLAGAALVLAVREVRGRGETAPPPSIRFSALPPSFRAYLVAWGAFALANSSDVFIILRAQHLLGAREHFAAGNRIALETVHVLVLYAFYNVIYAAASPRLGRLSDTLGRLRIFIGGLLVFALVYLGFAFADRVWQLWVLFGVYGLYTAATDGVGKALAVDLVPAGIRASAVGLLGTVTGVATIIASTVAGVLWGVWGPKGTFLYGVAGAVAGALLLSRVRTSEGRQ